MGQAQRESIVDVLPAGWSFVGKRVLDFGCGPGRTLRHFVSEAERAEFWGCDIHGPSIEWLERNLSPPLHVFVNDAKPPLPQRSGSFDLIWAISVFTHLTDDWSEWLLELRRLLTDDGLLIATFVNEGWRFALERVPWQDEWAEDQIGMHVVGAGNCWDVGGPVVFHSLWWIRAHWGRAFEILHLEPAGFGFPGSDYGMGIAVLRKTGNRLDPADLEAPEPGEERELTAARYSLRNTLREVAALRQQAVDFSGTVARPNAERDELAAIPPLRAIGHRWRRLARRWNLRA